MHFGLYAFDSVRASSTARPGRSRLARDGPDVLVRPRPAAITARDLPRQGRLPARRAASDHRAHNIHGIDIDPASGADRRAVALAARAAQLAGAGRAGRRAPAHPAQQRRVRRSRCPATAACWMNSWRRSTRRCWWRTNWCAASSTRCKLAGEAGSLLKIETELATAIAQGPGAVGGGPGGAGRAAAGGGDAATAPGRVVRRFQHRRRPRSGCRPRRGCWMRWRAMPGSTTCATASLRGTRRGGLRLSMCAGSGMTWC
jgi:hypothetical protein